ncbi:MAZ protein, partial [Aegotheles bennettii]|nr:MAZ protein [Aegotheles bennettii]
TSSMTSSEAQPPRKSKSKGPYICALCAKEFKNGYNLRRHEATHGATKGGATNPTNPNPTRAMKVPTMVPLSLLGGGPTEAGPSVTS